MCRAELQRLREVYPPYSGSVDFYVVGYDPTEGLERLEEYRRDRDLPWPVAVPEGNLVRDLEVLTRSTKVAFDSRGVIIYRDGYGRGGPEEWRAVLDMLNSNK